MSNRSNKLDEWDLDFKSEPVKIARNPIKKISNSSSTFQDNGKHITNSNNRVSVNKKAPAYNPNVVKAKFVSNDSNFNLYDKPEEQVIGVKQHQKNMELELQAQDAEFEDTVECNQCGRKFGRVAIAKHSKICQKVFFQKRKKFDMTKKRLGDLDELEPSQGGK